MAESPRRPALFMLALALLTGALVAAWPSRSAPRAEVVALAPTGTVHSAHCAPHAGEHTPTCPRSPGWHRGTGRRASRDPLPAAIALPVGSIPTPDPFTTQGLDGLLAAAPSYATGRTAAPPRAPPALN